MTDLFEGQLQSSISCLKCNHKSATFDNFMDLSIEIPRKAIKFTGSMSLNDCLKAFTTAEILTDGDNKCAGCKKEGSLGKGLSIFRFPKILCIHLKRFYQSGTGYEKICSTV